MSREELGSMAGEGENPTTETQLAVLRVKMDQLIELNKTRGEDHETRIRKLEERRFPLQTMAVLISMVALIATVVGMLLKF
jgi:hypothetical protein